MRLEKMWETLHKLFVGHNHEWEIISTNRGFDSKENYEIDLASKITYTLQCKICGNIKTKRI